MHNLRLDTWRPKPSHQFTVVFRASSPEFSASSFCPAAGTAPPPGMPTSRRLVMLTLPRLRTRGSLMRSFSDSARSRWLLVSPADVRLNIARRPRSEVERVGSASLTVCALRCGGEPRSRWCASGDDVWGIDTETRDIVMGAGDEERWATGAMLSG